MGLMAFPQSVERFTVAVMQSIDLDALIRVWDQAKLTKLLRCLLSLKFSGELMAGFEGNTVQYSSAEQLQDSIRMLEAALQKLETAAGTREDPGVRRIQHYNDYDRNEWR